MLNEKLNEKSASGFAYDAGADRATVLVQGAGSPRTGVAASLLLDESGYLVGVDVDPDGARVVVMLGAHENVSRTVSAKVDVDGRGVVIGKAASAVRGKEKNPYA
jgi:hypothetical protein